LVKRHSFPTLPKREEISTERSSKSRLIKYEEISVSQPG
jgi:hypothetical protein